jgi:diguanylate cyclase (GGDEF)-like protein
MAVLRLEGSVADSLHGAVTSIRGWQIWALREPLRGYLLGVIALAAMVIPLAASRVHWTPSRLAVFIALLTCGVVSIESTRAVKEIHGAIVRDLQPVWYLAIAITLPPAYALVAPVPLLAYKLWRTPGLVIYRRVFSNATISLAYGCAAWLFHAVPSSAAGPAPGAGVHVLTWVSVVVGCGVLAWVINDGLIVIAIKLADPGAHVRELVGNRDAITSDLIELSLAVSLALVVAINPVLMALALPSVLLYRRYMMSAQLVAQARIDPKTGLLNAGTWRREADVELARALRGPDPLALVIVHIDHFKSVHDTAGHPAGDQVLRAIVGIVTENMRGYDLIGRFGGEEFAVLLPQAGGDEARRITERLRDHIAGQPIAIEDGSHTGFLFRMTVSIGVATLGGPMATLAELVSAAGAALAEAKATGRNKVCMALVGSMEAGQAAEAP